MKSVIAIVLAVCAAVVIGAEQKILNDVFSDNMVLQCAPNTAVLFGENANPNARIPIFLDGVKVAEGKADANGKWIARLAPVPASNQARQLRVGQQVLKNVLFGNVFVCAGQQMQGVPASASVAESNIRAVRWSENAKQMYWAPVTAASGDACLNMGISAAKESGLPVGLVQAVYDAPLASWFPVTQNTVIRNDVQCSRCQFDESAWNAVLSHIVPMRFRSFVWVGDEQENCAEAKCVYRPFAESIRSKFTTNNLLLRSLKDDPFTIIGHRGMPTSCPENTIVSQVVARRAGTMWIEDDTQPSKDGVPFVLHDATVDRTTNGKGNIRDKTATELKALDAGSWFHPIFTGTRLPTLAEQLEDLQVNGGNLLLEIKGSHSFQEVNDIIDLIRKYNMTKHVLIQSFDRPSLEYSFQIAPDLPIGLLCNVEDDPVSTCKQMNLAAYNPDFNSLLKRPEVVKQLHDIGVIIFVWTPDTPSDWSTLMKLGVDGIITNKATILQGWVSAINQMESYGAYNTVDDSVEMPIAEQVFEGDDAKIIITQPGMKSSSTTSSSSVIIASRSANLGAIALH